MKNYYLPNSDDYYFNAPSWAKERHSLAKENANLLTLEQANQLAFERFFTKKNRDLKPHLNKNYHYLTLPYELDDIIFDDTTPTNILIEVLNQYIQGTKLIASTDIDSCCVVECGTLTEGIIDCLYSPHINTPFLVFNPNENVFALIDFDLPLQIIGYSEDFSVKIDNYDLIQQGFKTLFQRYASYTNIGNLFKDYYAFLLPKLILENLEI